MTTLDDAPVGDATTGGEPGRPGLMQRIGAAVRVLRERSWALTLVGVVVLSIAFVFLGRWQYGRYEGKAARIERVTSNYDRPAQPLATLLPGPDSPLNPGDQWRQVSVTGRYQADETTLIRTRPLDGVFGYEVVVPLLLPDGNRLLVDRGWIPNGRTGAQPDSLPAAPTGTVDVIVRLRPGEPGVDRTPPPGQAYRIDIPQLAARLDGPVYRAYGVLAAESPAPAVAPVLLPRPDDDLGMNLPYAIQWWAFTVAAYVIFVHFLGREATRRRLATGPGSGTAPAPSAGPDPSPAPGARSGGLLAGRRRRRGPTDEEIEDAL